MPDRVSLKKEASELIEGKTGTVFLPLLIYLVIASAIGCTSYYVYVSSLIIPIFHYLYVKWEFSFVREGKTTLDDYFKPFKDVDTTICYAVSAFLIELFCALWSILLIIPGIICYYNYAMALYIIAEGDKDKRYLDALKLSKNMMYGHRMEFFVLQLSFIGWFILCILTCGILYIWKGPYYHTTCILYYEYLKEEYEGKHPGTFANCKNSLDEDGDVIDAEVVDEDVMDAEVVDEDVFGDNANDNIFDA